MQKGGHAELFCASGLNRVRPLRRLSLATVTVNSGARLDRLPITRFHWNILGLIGAGAFLDAFDIYLANGALAAMVKSGFTDLRLGSFFISATFMGMMIGAGLSGYLGDRFGRRYSYQANLAIFGVASLAACFAPNIYWLILLRFIMGVGLGAELVVAAGTLCEFVPPATRGRWTALLALIINSGLLGATAIGYWVIPHLGWRYMFAIAGLGALIVWFLRHRMPESPRWLETVGRLDEAEATVSAIERQVEARVGKLPPVARVVSHEVPAAPFSALFVRGMIGRTLVAALTCMAINMSLYGFVAWLPTFFVKEGLTIVQSLGFVLLMSFGAPAGAVVGYLVTDRLGRVQWHRAVLARDDSARLRVRADALAGGDLGRGLRVGDGDLYGLHAWTVRLYPGVVPDRASVARNRCRGHVRTRGVDVHALCCVAALYAIRRDGCADDGRRRAASAQRRDSGAADRDQSADAGGYLARCRFDAAWGVDGEVGVAVPGECANV